MYSDRDNVTHAVITKALLDNGCSATKKGVNELYNLFNYKIEEYKRLFELNYDLKINELRKIIDKGEVE